MKQLRAIWPLSSVIALTVLSGVVSGVLSNRWGAPARARLSAEKLAELPDECGDWQVQSEMPIDKEVVEILQCVGNFHKIYRNRETGQLINVVLLLGPPGPISAHTPEICYSTRDYERLDGPRRHHVRLLDESEATLWRMTFRSRSLQGQTLSVGYAWNAGQGWLAPDSPRIAFAGQPMLYKLQFSVTIEADSVDESADASDDFLKAFLPACNASLF